MDNSSSTLNETVAVLDVLDSPLWVQVISATWLLVIFVFGTIENSVILYVFARNQKFVTTNNIPVIAMLLNCLCQSAFSTPLPFIAEISGGWDVRLSDSWCTFEAFIVYQFGLTSLYLLLQITLSRYVTITRPIEATQMTNVQALIGVLISYSAAAIFSVCPLFGFGSYGLETHKTSCGLAWNDQSSTGKAYIIVIFVFCFLLPVTLMAMSYTAIFKVRHRQTSSGDFAEDIDGIDEDQTDQIVPSDLVSIRLFSQPYTVRKSATIFPSENATSLRVRRQQEKERKLVKLSITMIATYLICWSPYAVVSFYTAFANPENLHPMLTRLPAFLAKSEVLWNPIIYTLQTKQFKNKVYHIIPCRKLRERLESSDEGVTQMPASETSHTVNVHVPITPKSGSSKRKISAQRPCSQQSKLFVVTEELKDVSETRLTSFSD